MISSWNRFTDSGISILFARKKFRQGSPFPVSRLKRLLETSRPSSKSRKLEGNCGAIEVSCPEVRKYVYMDMRNLEATMRKTLLMAFGIILTVPGLAAQTAPMETGVKRVALFKNGLGFFVREGKLPDARVVKIAPFAAPAHGTFWLSYPQQVPLQGLVARESAISTDAAVATAADLLAANVGREVIISWPALDRPPVRGKLLSVSDAPQQPRPDPYAWGRPEAPDPYNRSFSGGRLALIQTAEGIVGLDASVGQVTILGTAPATIVARKIRGWELEAQFKEASPGTVVAASYLAKGITWAPSYIVDISDPKQARLTAKAEVINEAEPLKDVHLDLVTGYPNLAYADVVSPLAGKADLAGFIAAMLKRTSPQGGAGYASALAQVRAGYNEEAAASIMPAYAAAAAGAAVEDLFFYPVEKVTLHKGEVGYFPLFSTSVPYRQIYTWEIPDYVNEQDQYGNQQREQRSTQEEVWHSLRLTNTMKLPWTTAPAQTVKTEQLLGQDMMEYTPSSAQTTLKITRAMAVHAEQTEREIQRERSAVHLYGWDFDRITIEGKLRVSNRKAESVEMEISKTLSGEVKETAPQAQAERLARGLARMNPVNLVTWSVALAPGERKEITYTYQALIRR